MQTLKSYLPHLLLAAVSLLLLASANSLKKEFEATQGRIVCQQIASPKTRELTATELMTVQDILAGLANTRGLPLKVTMQNKTFEITATDPQGIVARYNELLSFLSAVAYLPWNVTYETFCLGQECERGMFVMRLRLNARTN